MSTAIKPSAMSVLRRSPELLANFASQIKSYLEISMVMALQISDWD